MTFTVTLIDLWWVLPTLVTLISWGVAIWFYNDEMKGARFTLPWFVNPIFWFGALIASVLSLGSWIIYLLVHS